MSAVNDTRVIDLHTHTTASDGSFTPTELVNRAAEVGLAALGVTDHDTIAGLSEAAHAAAGAGIELVPGVELSVEDDVGRFHLLGYLFDPADPELAQTLTDIRRSRAERNVRMGELLSKLNLPVTLDDVFAEAGPDAQVVARPHFAQALMKKGVVGSVKEAFDRYLANGKPLYLPKQVLTPHDAIARLHAAGGVAVVAHPGLIPQNDEALAARVEKLTVESGLDGIEAYYSQHSPAQTERFLALAARYNLAVSGGSDFHGTPKPHVSLGGVIDGSPAPWSLLGALKARRPAVGS
jgi:hypothetical protein